MQLSKLTAGLPVSRGSGAGDPVITDLTEDSREVIPGSLFIARAGMNADGRRFAASAVERGAAAILSDGSMDEFPPAASNAVMLHATDVPLTAAQLAERFFGEPSARLDLIGVTGTNGKTTIAHLVQQMLHHAGRRCGLIGTVRIDDGVSTTPASLTTPPAIETSRLLARMVASGCRACVMESSSHALAQQRVAALRFRAAIFSNLTGDHLDYHGTMEFYAAAKAMLFASLAPEATAIINADDPRAEEMVRGCRAAIVRCRVDSSGPAQARAVLETMRASGMEAIFEGPWGSFRASLPLVGLHNLSNALEAAAACHALGVKGDALAEALEQCAAPPGRLEPVTTAAEPFSVLVDYAHTDDALRNVLDAMRPLVPSGARLIVVFGCGGDRDRTKRPRMANVAGTLADRIIITSDNPRTEDPEAIVREIEAGIPSAKRAVTEVIVERRRAIHRAVAMARDGDVVLIAGKGHEDYQILGVTKHPFDDRLIAREAMAERRARAGAA